LTNNQEFEALIESIETMSASQRLELVRNLKKEETHLIEFLHERIFWIKGIAFGLFYGIIGNIFVSYFIEVLGSIVMWQIDKLFWTNLIALAITLAVILFASWRWFISLAKLKGYEKESEKRTKIAKILEKYLTHAEEPKSPTTSKEKNSQ
jgi:hypothetical protein